MMYYEGQTTHLRNIWKSAVELELPVDDIMHRILGQMRFTHVIVPEKDEILLSYAVSPEHDDTLVQELLDDAAYAYFVQDAITGINTSWSTEPDRTARCGYITS